MIAKLFKYIKGLGTEPVADKDELAEDVRRAHSELLKALDAVDYAEAMAFYRRKQIERLNSYISNPDGFVADTCRGK